MQCKSYSHFSAKNIRILYIESAKTVNEMTLNEHVKLTTLWTTGPWTLTSLLSKTCFEQLGPGQFTKTVFPRGTKRRGDKETKTKLAINDTYVQFPADEKSIVDGHLHTATCKIQYNPNGSNPYSRTSTAWTALGSYKIVLNMDSFSQWD